MLLSLSHPLFSYKHTASISYPENGGSIFLRNDNNHYMISQETPLLGLCLWESLMNSSVVLAGPVGRGWGVALSAC